MTNVTEKTVLDFIRHFLEFDQLGDVRETFTSGCCYWFAKILADRFDGRIVYDSVNNHFAALTSAGIFDITGEITGDFKGHDWEWYRRFGDTIHAERIVRQCINFEEETA